MISSPNAMSSPLPSAVQTPKTVKARQTINSAKLATSIASALHEYCRDLSVTLPRSRGKTVFLEEAIESLLEAVKGMREGNDIPVSSIGIASPGHLTANHDENAGPGMTSTSKPARHRPPKAVPMQGVGENSFRSPLASSNTKASSSCLPSGASPLKTYAVRKVQNQIDAAGDKKISEEDKASGNGTGATLRHSTDGTTFEPTSPAITDLQLKSLPKTAFANVTVLNLKYCRLLTGEGLRYLTTHAPHVTSLDLSGTSDSLIQNGLPIALRAYRQTLRDLTVSNTNIRGRELKGLADCERLTSLNLSRCTSLSTEQFLQVLKLIGLASGLSKLVLDGVPCVNDGFIAQCSPYLIALKHLSVADCKELTSFGPVATQAQLLSYIDLSGTSIGDTCLQVIGNKCTSLQTLNLWECTNVTDTGLSALAQCGGLEYLDLEDCSRVTDVGLTNLLVGVKKLRSLSLHGLTNISDTGLFALADHCKQLESLDLWNCSRIGSAGLLSVIVSCSKLMSLKTWGCYMISDEVLHAFVCTAGNLVRINIGQCPFITASGLHALFNHCRKLERVSLEGLVFVDNAVVSHMAESCPNLKHVDLSGCVGVQDDGVVSLAEGCPDLHTLSLCGLESISNIAMTALKEHSPQLHTLNISCCTSSLLSDAVLSLIATGRITSLDMSAVPLVTDHFLNALSTANCDQLTHLYLGSCDQISKGATVKLLARYPGLELFR